MDSGTKVLIDANLLTILIPLWTLIWALIGYALGVLGKPKRYVLIEDSGAWTPAKLHSVDGRDDDAPIGKQRQPQG